MITPLPLDSGLFGYPIGKCQVAEDWDETSFIEQAKNYRLVYVFSEKPFQILSDRLMLADTKVTFEKRLDLPNEEDAEIGPYSGAMNDMLMSLALQSGEFSRFKTDPHFKDSEYEKLYRLWIQKALEDDTILTIADLPAMVTVEIQGESAKIGLLAVDRKHQGLGFGKQLLRAAEQFSYLQGAKKIVIPTQEANLPACRLYRSSGYQVTDRQHVYHYWNA